MSSLLPLFPLDLVLLPGAAQPLHIFEPRYKLMIGECLEEKKPFGIVRTQEDGIAALGCTAEIVELVKKYPDGKMDILTAGRQPFQVVSVNQELEFLRAEVQLLNDGPGHAPPEQVSQAVKLHGDILTLAEAAPAQFDPDDRHLSFHLAASLPLDLDFKQGLLGMRSEAERIPAIITYFEAILPKLRHSVRVRSKAGGNGHAR